MLGWLSVLISLPAFELILRSSGRISVPSPFPGTVSKRTGTLPGENLKTIVVNLAVYRGMLEHMLMYMPCSGNFQGYTRPHDIAMFLLMRIPVCAQIGLFICWPARSGVTNTGISCRWHLKRFEDDPQTSIQRSSLPSVGEPRNINKP